MSRTPAHWRPGPADRLPGRRPDISTPQDKTTDRAAYYARGTQGWRAYWTLLHPPYTVMHLSFVVVGAALAPTLFIDRLLWTLVAFFLAMGLAAHALDEQNGRPLNTNISNAVLGALAVLGLVGAATIGVWGAIHYDLLPGIALIAVGVLLVVAYNLELFSGRMHNDLSFVLAWGAFPVLVAYYAQTGRIDLVAGIAAAYATLLSGVQRVLSTKARDLRRRVDHVTGLLHHPNHSTTTITKKGMLAPYEHALRLLVATSIVVAGLLLWQAVG